MQQEPTKQTDDLKSRTASTLKWNVIDRLSTQVLYAVTGIVLAWLLDAEDFGLVGAVLVFQAFASLLVDSGFSSALIQRKNPTQTDYSTVLWFNLGVAGVLYVILFICAPLIADCFGGDQLIIPLARVMFLTFILNASSIVQVNRLMKQMDVKPICIANCAGLLAGSVVGIWIAYRGGGAWAIVWQSIALSGIKSLVLWISQRWRPSLEFSFQSLRSYFKIGSRLMMTSFLNTLFLNIYSFFIGNRAGMSQLGYYTQADKWSKMGIMSMYQVLTTSFLPALSAVQDDKERFTRVAAKMNRFTSYLAFPAFLGLTAMATPIFHSLFGTKWDASILLFQILLLRGIFTVFIGYYNNVLLALGNARTIMWMEVLRDGVALAALAGTLPFISLSQPGDPVWGVSILLYGQLAASAVTWTATLWAVSRHTERSIGAYFRDMAPYALLSLVLAGGAWWIGTAIVNPYAALCAQIAVGLGGYLAVGYASGSTIQRDALSFVIRRPKK